MSDLATFTIQEKQEMSEIINGIRTKAEKYGIEAADFKRYSDNADKKLAELDAKNDKISKSLAEKENIEKELKDRIKHLETIGVNANVIPVDTKKDAHDVFNAIAKKRWAKLVEEKPALAHNFFKGLGDRDGDSPQDFPTEAKNFERRVREYKVNPDIIRTDIGEFGGFLTPIEWSNELLKQIIEYSPMRKYGRVKQISGKTLMQPIRQGVPTATWAGQTETGSDSISNYVLEEITPYRLTNTVPVTWDMMNDSKYNISEEIMADNAIAFAQAEGKAFVSGNAVKKPFGFTQDTNVPIFTTSTSTLTFDDIIKVTGQLKMGYNPMYFFNRRTLAYLRTLKDLNDRYLWSGPFGDAGAGAASTINGYRYSAEFIDMDDYNTSTGIPILFADMFKFYQITDRTDVIVIRDEYTRKKEAIVEFTLQKWTTGQVVVKEAGIILKLNS